MATLAILYPPVLANQDDPATLLVPRIAGATITAGQVVYDDPTTAKMLVADAAVAGKHTPGGMALYNDAAAGGVVSVCTSGFVAGFNLAALNAGTLIYLDTAGTLNTTANATTTVPIGKVVGSGLIEADGTIRKLLHLFIDPKLAY